MYDYRDASAPIEERIKHLLDQMTPEEKIGQMTQLPANIEGNTDKLEHWHVGSYLHCAGEKAHHLQQRAANTRLGIPILFAIDAIHGHCFENNATVFPTQLAASCAWDTAMLYNMGRVTATEVRGCGIHWTFSPVLCVARDTRWGRVNETFGEDPWLIGELASALIKGYQGDSLNAPDTVMACAKHYVAYGETIGGRDAYESSISRRMLLNHFLPPFEKVVKEAGVATLMAGYQSIDGTPCSADPWLMRDLPKNQWGMDGFVVTDWDNVGALHEKQFVASSYDEATQIAVTAGNDMIMTTQSFYDSALAQLKSGALDSRWVDDAVTRILRYKFKLGLFDQRRYADSAAKADIIGKPEHWQHALEASRKCLTLLKNSAQTLPLNAANLDKILVVGPNADNIKAQLGDWSFGSYQAGATDDQMHKANTVTVLQGIQQHLVDRPVEVTYVQGAHCADASINQIDQARAEAEDSDAIVVCVGDTLSQQGEFHDRSDLQLGGNQHALLEALKATGKPLIVVFIASKPLAISWIKENANAILCAFNPGAKGGTAIAETLFGANNPSGKLTISFPYSAGQLPVYYNSYPGWHSVLSNQLDGQERYIDAPAEPVFSFGEGLSYTEFQYSDLKVATPALKPEQDLSVKVTLRNTGDRDGTEVVQLYIRDIYSSVVTPIKNLRAFQRVTLAAGEAKVVTLTVQYWDLALINCALEKVVEPGEFELMVGGSSKDEHLLKARFTVLGA
ncbi:MAG TPA: glycoside hydrolase family 3 N-terminal domain-containing protein [Marinagarivorans sp.]